MFSFKGKNTKMVMCFFAFLFFGFILFNTLGKSMDGFEPARAIRPGGMPITTPTVGPIRGIRPGGMPITTPTVGFMAVGTSGHSYSRGGPITTPTVGPTYRERKYTGEHGL